MGMEGVRPSSFDNFWRDRLGYYSQTAEFQMLFDQLESELVVPARRLPTPVVVSFIGIPGSGKSTLSTMLQELIPALHLRTDVIGLERLPRGSTHDYYKAYVILEALARHYLAQGYSVIMDDNNRTRYNREQTYRLAQSYNAQNILFRLTLPFDIAVRRTQRRNEEGSRGIRSEERIRPALLFFQSQIEEPQPEEINDFQVLYKTVNTNRSVAEIRGELVSCLRSSLTKSGKVIGY